MRKALRKPGAKLPATLPFVGATPNAQATVAAALPLVVNVKAWNYEPAKNAAKRELTARLSALQKCRWCPLCHMLCQTTDGPLEWNLTNPELHTLSGAKRQKGRHPWPKCKGTGRAPNSDEKKTEARRIQSARRKIERRLRKINKKK